MMCKPGFFEVRSSRQIALGGVVKSLEVWGFGGLGVLVVLAVSGFGGFVVLGVWGSRILGVYGFGLSLGLWTLRPLIYRVRQKGA